MLNEDFTMEDLLDKFPHAKTFPQITQHGNYVGECLCWQGEVFHGFAEKFKQGFLFFVWKFP